MYLLATDGFGFESHLNTYIYIRTTVSARSQNSSPLVLLLSAESAFISSGGLTNKTTGSKRLLIPQLSAKWFLSQRAGDERYWVSESNQPIFCTSISLAADRERTGHWMNWSQHKLMIHHLTEGRPLREDQSRAAHPRSAQKNHFGVSKVTNFINAWNFL